EDTLRSIPCRRKQCQRLFSGKAPSRARQEVSPTCKKKTVRRSTSGFDGPSSGAG
ncbi:unnamed protein product, partial [Amoebophrya sp. A120]